MRRYVCIHGHFYQPPRENPWLEEVERQESARPFHDWNERICREAYAPNAFSRILDGQGRIVRIVNNYARMSFNFGPTLLSWLERKAPETYEAILQADRQSRERFSGHGSALAQAYNHMILPLASSRDRRTQIAWGIHDFRHRFGRPPEGMWLPETAVDLESLDLMAEAGIRFTVLAPRQASAVRNSPDGVWEDVTGERVDPSQAYRVALPSGREMAVFFYDGALSRAIAFEELLSNGGVLARRLLDAGGDGAALGAAPGPGLTHVATDGETYGHHHRHGEMALSYALKVLEENPDTRLTNYGEFLERHPPTREARIVEGSSWSCIHGVERWRSDCGCSTGDHVDWRQEWREPLREALDWLRDELEPHFEEEAGALLRDPWRARDRYVEVVLDRTPENVDRFLDQEGLRPLTPPERIRVLKLLEIQRHAMLMYTSCGWFFDDLARIETLQVLRYAARALHLHQVLAGTGLEAEFMDRLSRARSSVPGLGTGADLYRTRVAPDRVELAKVAAHHAVSSLFLDGTAVSGSRHRVYAYDVRVEEAQPANSGGIRLSMGRMEVSSTITRTFGRFTFGVLHMGDHLVVGGVRGFEGMEAYQDLIGRLRSRFEEGDALEMIRILDREFRAASYSLSSLFRDEQERVVDRILKDSLAGAEGVLHNLFESRLPLMRFLAGLQVPQPRPFRAVGEFILDLRLERALAAEPPEISRAEDLFREAELTGLRMDRERLGFEVAGALERTLRHLEQEPDNLRLLTSVRRLVAFIRSLPFALDLWDAQNTFFRILEGEFRRRVELVQGGDLEPLPWILEFGGVGRTLGIAVPEPPLPAVEAGRGSLDPER